VRVVSLVPSVTETLLAWGVTPVAVTRFCEQPGFPTVGGTKNPDLRAITALQPDLVVVDREENRKEDAEALAAAGVPVHVMHVRALADVAPALAGLAAALHAAPALHGAPDGPRRGDGRLRVWVPIWRRPWMSVNASTYGSSLLDAAGFVNVLAGVPEPYPQVELPAVAELSPDRVLAPSEPYAFRERHRAELEQVAPVTFVDGKDVFWWGWRTPGALGRLRRLADTLG
jgi:ABC-type Fe3+-hydroxamate transport system substrate-binding protein